MDLLPLNAVLRPVDSTAPALLHDGIAARLRSMVLEHQLAPGQWIDEKALATAWQVSRTPLREALRMLAAEGLVELVPQRGSRVVELGDDDADALFPVLALLEGRCAAEAAAKASDADIAGLRRMHQALEDCAAALDAEGCKRVDDEFHARVQALAGNRWLARATVDLRRFMPLMRAPAVPLEASVTEHHALIDAIALRDAGRAERVMHDHRMAQLDARRRRRAIEPAEETRDAR